MPVTTVTNVEVHGAAWSGQMTDLQLVLDKFQEQAIRIVGVPPDEPDPDCTVSERFEYVRRVQECSVSARFVGGIHRSEVSGLLPEVLASAEVDLTKAVSLRVWCGGDYLNPAPKIEIRFENAAYRSGVTLKISAGEAEALGSKAVIWPIIKENIPRWAWLRNVWTATIASTIAYLSAFCLVASVMNLLDVELDTSISISILILVVATNVFTSGWVNNFIEERAFPGFEVADGSRVPASIRFRNKVWQGLAALIALLSLALAVVSLVDK